MSMHSCTSINACCVIPYIVIVKISFSCIAIYSISHCRKNTCMDEHVVENYPYMHSCHHCGLFRELLNTKLFVYSIKSVFQLYSIGSATCIACIIFFNVYIVFVHSVFIRFITDPRHARFNPRFMYSIYPNMHSNYNTHLI